MIPFSGAALPLGSDDIAAAAADLGCSVACVRAVLTVETGGAGGFLGDGSGRPRILFEAQVFGALTGYLWDASHPDVSREVADWHLYRGGAAEYLRLEEAVALNRSAALQSASWGLFQILAENAKICGYADAETFVAGMAESEGNQLQAFVKFCGSLNLGVVLRDHDWATFGRRYNGPAYHANGYDTRLAQAYTLAIGAPDVPLRLGCTGAKVFSLQQALNAAGADLATDGVFGRVTDLAVRRFQESNGLDVDGIVGVATARALHLI